MTDDRTKRQRRAEPPQDVAAEEAALGAAMLDPDACAEVLDRLAAEDFYRPAHRTVFEAIRALHRQGRPVDAVTVGGELSAAGVLADVGGGPFLHTLIASVPTAAAAGTYAAQVAKLSRCRRLIDAGYRIAQLAGEETDPDRAESLVRELLAGEGRGGSAGRVERFTARLLTVAQLVAQDPPEVLIGDLLYRSTLAVLFGLPGSYKTFTALDWALCVAAGLPWQAREVRGGGVLYVAAEGSAGLGQRIEAWVEGFAAGIPERFRVYPGAVNLLVPEERDTLAAWAAANRPALIVLDTLARSMVGGDENSARDMGQVIDSADLIRRASAATVLGIHHTTKDGTSIRGSSALQGAADTLIEAKADGRVVTLRCEKQKDATPFEPVRLRADQVPLAKGESVVLRGFGGLHVRTALEAHEEAVRAALTDDFARTGASRKVLCEHLSLSESQVSRAVNALAKRGAVVNIGSDKRPLWKAAP
jgi:hypothetical protein